MKAVCIHKYGERDVLSYEDRPVPEIQEDEVLIRVVASSVNPVDWKIRKGYLQKMIPYEFPLILGWDAAGIIERVGKKVSDFSAGDAVYTRPELTRNGSYAEYLAVRANEVAPKPSTISFMEAASLPLVSITAWESVINSGEIKKGQSILIHGGAGGVGSIAIQLAKWKGARVITTASRKNIDFLKSLGADEVIDYGAVKFEEAVSGVDVVFDTIGGEVQERSFRVLKKGGIIVSVTQTPSESLCDKNGVKGRFVFIQPDAAILRELAGLVDSGVVRPVVGAEFALEDISLAHGLSESGHTRGKIVIHVGRP